MFICCRKGRNLSFLRYKVQPKLPIGKTTVPKNKFGNLLPSMAQLLSAVSSKVDVEGSTRTQGRLFGF